MHRSRYFFFIFFIISFFNVHAQNTDLAVVVEAQDLNGNDVSQVHIYQEFQYVVTLINSGNDVSDVTFSQQINPNVTILNQISENNTNGATEATNFNITTDNEFTGFVASMPNNSTVQIKVIVRAPLNIGGIATSVNVFPPNGTEDTNQSNNESIISIDVTDLPIDFTVVNSQISPAPGTPLGAWDDNIVYEFTITNNSSIEFPLTDFFGHFSLSSAPEVGQPSVQFESLECVGASSGFDCIDTSTAAFLSNTIGDTSPNFNLNQSITFPAGASLTFQITYSFFEPLCTLETDSIIVDNYIKLNLNHSNVSSNDSNLVNSILLPTPDCLIADLEIVTTQLNPAPGVLVNWNEAVSFETTVTNNGPSEAPIQFFVQNLTLGLAWEIISVNCVNATNGFDCADIDLTTEVLFWSSNEFDVPANTSITIAFTVRYFETPCAIMPEMTIGYVRSVVNILSTEISDPNLDNNFDDDYVTLPLGPACTGSDIVDLEITKTQVVPEPPEGSSSSNTTNWGDITYEITITNPTDEDALIIARDYFQTTTAIATLQSVTCVATTGTAECDTINFAQIGVPLDGIPQDGNVDVFWSIDEDDNWQLPAQSSVTFETVIFWEPICSTTAIAVVNKADAYVTSHIDDNFLNNEDEVTTFFAPCVDLVVQTFPEFTSVSVNQNFDWIVDITNSETSSNATDVFLEDLLDDVFTISGTPTCEVTSGVASCIPSFNIANNVISGTIPNMEAGSTVRIRIPVTAPNFGGAYTNLAEATPSVLNNAEITPETNISISNVQVLAPSVLKSFSPDEIIVGNQSTLTFTLSNLASNEAQTNISFTDNLPLGLTIIGDPFWVESNGCTTTFVGNDGDNFVGVNNLNFPDGVSTCSFAVVVTSDTIGTYLNDFNNFSNLSNIDPSQASATLNVIDDNTNVDIAILKNVFPTEASLGDQVEFTISVTNLGTTPATLIEIFESLPSGYQVISFSASLGSYSDLDFIWMLPLLDPNQTETLSIIAQIVSSQDLVNTALLFDVNETDRDDTNNEDSAEVILDNCFTISEGISPNNDGLNDTLMIPCIEEYPSNTLQIFSRYGNMVYETVGYKNDWKGVSNKGILRTNSVLPVGTYYYILQLDTTSKPIVGWIYLNY